LLYNILYYYIISGRTVKKTPHQTINICDFCVYEHVDPSRVFKITGKLETNRSACPLSVSNDKKYN
jgi:hypothetical protein